MQSAQTSKLKVEIVSRNCCFQQCTRLSAGCNVKTELWLECPSVCTYIKNCDHHINYDTSHECTSLTWTKARLGLGIVSNLIPIPNDSLS